MIAKSKQRQYPHIDKHTSGYWVRKENHEGLYHTGSIVKARAYAVKMIRENKDGWTWWDIYNNKITKVSRGFSSVVYRPESNDYVWYHQTSEGDSHRIITKIYTDGRIKR